MITSLVFIFAMSVLMPLEAQILQGTEFGMGLILCIIFVLGFMNVLCYASVSGLTSQINGKCTTYFLIGVAIFGLVNNLFREATLLIFQPASDGELPPIITNFAFTLLIVLIALCLHNSLMKSEFYAYHFLTKEEFHSSVNSNAMSLIAKNTMKPKRDLKTLLTTFKKVKYHLILLLCLYIQHALLYPGVMLEKPINGMADHSKTVSMICAFSVFFILGKKGGQYRKYYSIGTIATIALLRFIFIATFLLQAENTQLPIIRAVWFGYVNIAIFAFTLGYSNVALFIMGPEQVGDEFKEIAGFLNVFALNLGSMIGGFSSLLLVDA